MLICPLALKMGISWSFDVKNTFIAMKIIWCVLAGLHVYFSKRWPLYTHFKGQERNLQFFKNLSVGPQEYIISFSFTISVFLTPENPKYSNLRVQRLNLKFSQKSTCRSSSVHPGNFQLPDRVQQVSKLPGADFWAFFIFF